ncbi:MAG: XdhC family protein [Burkholderiaceae bacterium]|jgi:xanthine dehydrogenase accessory factor
MDNVDLSVLGRIGEWRKANERVVMGTIVRTWGSAPRPIGSVVAIRGDGHIAGSVSGGCIEDDLIDKVRAGALGLKVPDRIKYGISAEEANRFGLPCGGTLELVLEPVTEHSRVDELLRRLQKGERIRRTLDLRSGDVTLEPGEGADRLVLTDSELITFHGPQWRLLIIGAGQMTEYLASMARTLDYQVIVCDPREEYADDWQMPGTELVRTMPDDTVLALHPDAHTAIIALTHDPKLDDLALMEALKSDAFYVGAIGSRANQEKRRARLLEFDVSAEQLDRLFGPVGLKNGARTPPEIAVSILAQMTAQRYGYQIPDPIALADTPKLAAGCVA